MIRQVRALSLALLGAVGCGAPAEAEPGRETGACVDFTCLGDLVCLSNLCVDPNATPPVLTDGGDDDPGDTGEETGSQGLSSVSVLVILDNSGSMGEEQVTFVDGLNSLAQQLTEAGLDWRIGVTTTDNGSPWCTGTGPEAGKLRLSSCRGRQTEFTFDGASTIDAFEEACAASCPEEWASIEVEPTTADGSTGSSPRPWLQSIGGTTNLPVGLLLHDAIDCTIPQGINGCGFEQPLESMRRALRLARVPEDPSYGFIPDDALLVVIIVTDEVDCSHNADHESIFLGDGNRTFWSDPSAPAPSSAVCWNAGVSCSGSSCASADYDVLGGVVAPEDAAQDAVLHPLDRYRAELAFYGGMLLVHIAGYQADGSVTYQPGDPEFQGDFGIGPGCGSTAGLAVPPVRVREIAQDLAVADAPSAVSICSASFEPQMTELAAAITTRLTP